MKRTITAAILLGILLLPGIGVCNVTQRPSDVEAAREAPTSTPGEIEVVRYLTQISEDDTRYAYPIALLGTALQKTVETDGPFELQPTKRMTQPRYKEELKQGRMIDIIWTPTNPQLEEDLLPIRIPVQKALLGYRVFLIRKEDKEKFAAIQTLDELKQLRAGMGTDWTDTKILQQNGLNVVTGSSYEGLFEMLIKGRFDYFPRGINEAPLEYEVRKEDFPDLFIEENVLLYYPYPVYFFVNKDNVRLADRVERGLNMMIEDGSFDELFLEHHREMIEQANLKNRRLFKIENPLLPATVPFDRRELWYDPFAGRGDEYYGL